MLAIIAAHVALLAVVMSAKMDLPHRIFDPPTKVILGSEATASPAADADASNCAASEQLD